MIQQIKKLKNLYLIIFIIILILIINTPLLISSGISIFNEEIVKVFMLLILLILSLIVYYLYRNELNKNYQQLDDALNYIGAVKEIFNDLNKFPESKNDFKYIQESLAK